MSSRCLVGLEGWSGMTELAGSVSLGVYRTVEKCTKETLVDF